MLCIHKRDRLFAFCLGSWLITQMCSISVCATLHNHLKSSYYNPTNAATAFSWKRCVTDQWDENDTCSMRSPRGIIWSGVSRNLSRIATSDIMKAGIWTSLHYTSRVERCGMWVQVHQQVTDTRPSFIFFTVNGSLIAMLFTQQSCRMQTPKVCLWLASRGKERETCICSLLTSPYSAQQHDKGWRQMQLLHRR